MQENQNHNYNQKITTEKIFSLKKTNKRDSTRTALVFVIGFTVGVLVTSSWGTVKPRVVNAPTNTYHNITTVATTTSITSSTGLARGDVIGGAASGDISVSNQPAGSSVLVDSVTVPPPGVWVTVQETHNGVLGNVLGATRVHGPLSNVVVSLLRNTEPNRTYAVVLYRGSGDNGLFDLKTDSVYVDFDTSKRVVVPFHTTASSATTVPVTH